MHRLRSKFLEVALKGLMNILLVVALLLPALPVLGQAGGYVSISNIVTDQFPVITFTMTAHNQDGSFIDKLNIDNVHVLEDNQSRNIENIKYSDPGMQFILAVNSAPAFGYFAGGVVRFDNVRKQLVNWINNRPVESSDDFSLVTAQDALAQRVASPLDFLPFIENFKPNFNTAIPSTNALSRALDLASGANPRPNMQRVILYLTPLPDTTELPVLQTLADRATQLNVHIFIWLIAYSNFSASPEASALQQVAARTGGQYFLYSGLETLPDPETYFAPLRGLYTVTYSSIINQSGIHSISALVKTSTGEITSPPQTINLTVSAPIPQFLSSPTQIERAWANDTQGTTLMPQTVSLDFQVEFPDGYERQLTKAQLWVDGQVVQEITDLTKKQFTWQLPAEDGSGQNSGQHTIQISVVDILGLTGKSGEIPIQITITSIQRTGWQIFMSNIFSGNHVIIFIAVIISAAALVTILILSSRGHRFRLSRRPSRKEIHDPVTQPVIIRPEKNKPSSTNGQVNLAPLPPQQPALPLLARFVPADQSGKKADTAKSLIIRQPDVTLGRDNRQADVVISSPSVSPLHARLHLNENGVYILSDAGSVGGTWVNYAPVSAQGVHLEHNDLVNFGKASFRFEIIKTNP